MALLTKTELLALLPDNVTGEISPGDLRDIVNNVMGVYGGIVHSESGVATQTIGTTPETILQWEFAMPSNGVVVDVSGVNSGSITVQVDGDYEIHYSLTYMGTTNDYHVHLYKDDALVHPQIGMITKGSAADSINMSMNTIVTLASGDKMSLYINCSANNKIFDIEHGMFIMKRLG